MTKHKKLIQEMLEINKDIFKSFKEIHDKYIIDPDKWQEELNKNGQEVLLIIQQWENKLCSKSTSSQYSKFSTNLSDKFWKEIRIIFPKIDYVGITNE